MPRARRVEFDNSAPVLAILLMSASIRKLRATLAQIRANEITEANLSDLGINKFIVKEVQDALTENNGLTKLNLARNQLADEGARMIALLFRQGKLANLIALDLANNGISKDGAQELLESLEHNFVLENLDINETQKTSLAIKDVQFRIDSSAFDLLYGTSTEQSKIRQLLDSNSKLKKVLRFLKDSYFLFHSLFSLFSLISSTVRYRGIPEAAPHQTQLNCCSSSVAAGHSTSSPRFVKQSANIITRRDGGTHEP